MRKLPVYVKGVVMLFGLTNLCFILSAGASFLIPLAVAALLSLLLKPACDRLESWKFPRAAAILVCLLGVVTLLGAAIALIVNQFIQFGTELPAITDKLARYAERLQDFIEDRFDISSQNQTGYVENMVENALQSSGALLTATATSTLGFLTSAFLVVLYTFFMLYYRSFFNGVLYQTFAHEQHQTVAAVIRRVQGVVQNYLSGVFTVVLILTVLNTAGLALIGINYAFFFGAVAGLLNILPFIGVFIGSALPVLYAFVSKDSLWYPLGALILFNVIQTLESSVFTPNIVGSRVSLNPFAAVLALIIGGQLWGPVGMILFIPFTAVLKVICDEVPTLRPFGTLLGDSKQEAGDHKSSLAGRLTAKIK
jgi:predicted PurR-regulated permease PerM